MANEEHFSLLGKGVSVWNEWRRNSPEITPDLSSANLQGMYLECVNFENVDLTGANLSQCKLRWARFNGATLDRVNTDGADFVNTALASMLEQQKVKIASLLIKQKAEEGRRRRLAQQSQRTLEKYIQDFNLQNLEHCIGVKRSGFSRNYRQAIEESLKDFVRNGDDIVCIGYYFHEDGHCEMCGHHPIKWHYILENLQNHSQIHVGSECIQNFQIILSEWGYRPEYIVFPNYLRPYTRWILNKNPQSIVFNDDIVVHLNKDCEEIIKGMGQDSQLKHYRYVKRSNYKGIEKLIAINNPEQQLNYSQQILTTPKLEYDDYPPF
ncbi:MAG: pentapeptide repeat-containing protein [Nodosilinea sp.]